MKPSTVRRRVRVIDGLSVDDESAHAAEDQLHQDVLRAIANGAPEPDRLAAEALRTLDITFARWFA